MRGSTIDFADEWWRSGWRRLAIASLLVAGALTWFSPSAVQAAGAVGVFWRTITASGTSTESWVTLYGTGRGTLDLTGSFGGGLVTIQRALPDGSTVDISAGGYSSAVLGYTFDLGGCSNIRIVLTGATSPNLTWSITPEFYRQPTPQSPDCTPTAP